MKKEEANAPERDSHTINNSRREFLRNSVYAAYATPLITALLVSEAEAGASQANDCPAACRQPNPPDTINCSGCN